MEEEEEESEAGVQTNEEMDTVEHQEEADEPAQPAAQAKRKYRTPSVSAKKHKGKMDDERACFHAIQQYFEGKKTPTENDDDAFCRMLAYEMQRVQCANVKRQLKQQLLELVLSAQQLQETQNMIAMVVAQAPEVTEAAPVCTETNEPQPGTSSSSIDAELLLQLQQTQ